MTPDLTIGQALSQATEMLERAAVGVPRLTAEVLLAHALGKDRTWLIAHSPDPLTELAWIHFGRYLHQRLEGVPTQYITRRQEFYGREFVVSPDVLIPRPETEHIVEAVIEHKPRGRVLDVGTGSGAIAVSIALETKATVFASDVSLAAVRVARENAARLGAAVRFFCADLLSAVPDASFEVITCNPPYVPERDKPGIQREVRDHEPQVALWGGYDGMDVYRRLIPEAWRVLRPGGWLLMELGYSAVRPVTAMLNEWAGGEIRGDLAGLPRVAVARKP